MTKHRLFLCSVTTDNAIRKRGGELRAMETRTDMLNNYLARCKECVSQHQHAVRFEVEECMREHIVWWRGIQALDDRLISQWKCLWQDTFGTSTECKIISNHYSEVKMICPRVYFQASQDMPNSSPGCGTSVSNSTENKHTACLSFTLPPVLWWCELLVFAWITLFLLQAYNANTDYFLILINTLINTPDSMRYSLFS